MTIRWLTDEERTAIPSTCAFSLTGTPCLEPSEWAYRSKFYCSGHAQEALEQMLADTSADVSQYQFVARAHLARKRALEDELRQDLNILTDALPLEYLRSGLRIRHNHMTRVVKDPGLCPACDKYREER